MSYYQLKPGLKIVKDHAVPPVCATEFVMAPPQPSSLNYCCRPSTVVYGTAPYMAGKGAPNHLIMVEDELRPQSTSEFNKFVIDNRKGGYFPINNVTCALPQRTLSFDPISSRASVQNSLFSKRYCNK